MPINPEAVGTVAEPMKTTWDSDRCLLYALGVGAGVDELEFTTDNSMNISQRVLPTMAVVLYKVGGAMAKIGTFNPALLVHGGQKITLFREIPTSGTCTTVSEITAIYDKGKGAVVEMTCKSTLDTDDEPLFTNVTSMYLRGEGGFGGDRGPSGPTNVPPDRAPDHEVTYHTNRDSALLYRMSGDKNPLHSDPDFAKLAGFDRPILHGLCTYGYTGRALLHALCESDPAKFRSMEGRFSSPVYPGESLTVKMWVDGGQAIFQSCGDDGRVVLESGLCTFA